MMQLHWRPAPKVFGGRKAWTADGVYGDQWYSLKRDHAKFWVAVFHHHDGEKPVAKVLGKGTFGAMKKTCRMHAIRIWTTTVLSR